MNTLSRTITGIIGCIAGIFLIIMSFFESYFLLLYGIPVLLIGVFILFNKKEDTIEQIKKK